MLISLQH
ncbi:hypothetical protein VCHC41A1_3374, partial [Vibrio cholerae HC-41A1]